MFIDIHKKSLMVPGHQFQVYLTLTKSFKSILSQKEFGKEKASTV